MSPRSPRFRTSFIDDERLDRLNGLFSKNNPNESEDAGNSVTVENTLIFPVGFGWGRMNFTMLLSHSIRFDAVCSCCC